MLTHSQCLRSALTNTRHLYALMTGASLLLVTLRGGPGYWHLYALHGLVPLRGSLFLFPPPSASGQPQLLHVESAQETLGSLCCPPLPRAPEHTQGLTSNDALHVALPSFTIVL